MTIEEFLLLALVLIYIAISYGHSPADRSADQQDEMHPERFHKR